MKLIIGIGNPGIKYTNTRHNIGFQILDKFCEKLKLRFEPAKSNFWFVESIFDTFHFFLVKPTLYVNNTGLVVKELITNNNISIEDVLIIYDDTNLETGSLRLRKSGSDGGHNGIKSIIYHTESDQFPRIRVGVGSPSENEELSDYVLSNFPKLELDNIENKVPFIIDLIEQFIIGGSSAMLDFYSKQSNINSSNIS